MARKALLPSTTTIDQGLTELIRASRADLDRSEIVSLVRAALEHAEGRAPRRFYSFVPGQAFAGGEPLDATPGASPRRRRAEAFKIMNAVLDTAGVLYIASMQDTATLDRGLTYLHVGAAYAPTVVYDHGTGTWSITSYGERVEAHPERFGPGTHEEPVENPDDGVLFDDPLLGVMLHHWHYGQDDPIYAAGSLIYVGQPVPRELLEETIGSLETLLRRTKTRSERRELRSLLAALK